MLRTSAVIVDIEYSPSREVTFVRFQPEEPFEFQEWQFMMIESIFLHEDLGKPLKKPYSIATTNEELQEKWTLGVIVKKTLNGYMSDYLTQGIQVGDKVILAGPAGHMIDQGERNHYLLVSTGSGVSPMVGLYNELKKNPHNKISNLFGERYMKNLLPSVVQDFSEQTEQIKNILCLSQEEVLNTQNLKLKTSKGRIQSQLDEALSFLWEWSNAEIQNLTLKTQNFSSVSVFLCGAPEMVDDVKKILIEKWIPKEQIKSEKY